MLVNLLRILLIIWVAWSLIRMYNRWRAKEKKKYFEQGRMSASRNGKGSMNTDNIGDYVDYEEVKDS